MFLCTMINKLFFPKITALFSLFFIFLTYLDSFAFEIPIMQGRVNDYAKVLSAETITDINQKLAKLEQEDTTQLFVLTIPRLDGVPIEDYAVKVFNSWGVGQKKLDNGILFIIAKDDHKLRIEVGRGLEGKLPDVLAGEIIRDDVVPLLKKEDYNGGVLSGVDNIIKIIKGEYVNQNHQNTDTKQLNTLENSDTKNLPYGIFHMFFLLPLLGLFNKASEKIKKYKLIFFIISCSFIVVSNIITFIINKGDNILPNTIVSIMLIILYYGFLFGKRVSGINSISSSGGSSSSGSSSSSGQGGRSGGGGASGSW